MDENKVVCFCKKVTYGQIMEAVNNGADTVEKVAEATGATVGCGGCKGKVQDIIDSAK